jgi:pimeloyl-ACP methyl ester carboxylesterase
MIPILLLHGALGSSDQFKDLEKTLVKEGFSVLTLNFSGHGGRPFGNEFGIRNFAEEVKEFLASNNLTQVNIFGYSMGGYVALWLAYLDPSKVNRIITLGTKFDWNPVSADKEIAKLDPEKIIEKVPAFASVLAARHSPVSWKLLMNKTSQLMAALGTRPLLTEEVLSRIGHKTLITVGERDDMADVTYSKSVAHLLQNGSFRLLEDTPHLLEKTDVLKVKAVVENFFKD